MHRPITLRDSFKGSGEWWLPSSTDDRVRGTLSFGPQEFATLELMHCFKSLPQSELMKSGGRLRIPSLLGQSDDGRLWVAADCMILSFGMTDSDELSLGPSYLIHGCHPTSEKTSAKVAFSALKIKSNELTDWVQKQPEQDIQLPIVQIKYTTEPIELLAADIQIPQVGFLLTVAFTLHLERIPFQWSPKPSFILIAQN